MDAEEYRRKFEAGEITEDEELIWLRNKFAGIYCDNIEKHADIKDYEDGMYYCRHCYREMKAVLTAAEAFIEASSNDPDIAEIYDRYIKAKEALGNG